MPDTCEPLKPNEIRTLNVGEPFDTCSHTSLDTVKTDAPGFDVLSLLDQAKENVMKINVLYTVQDSLDGSVKKESYSGTGFVVTSPFTGKKELVSAGHTFKDPGIITENYAVDNTVSYIIDGNPFMGAYNLVLRKNQPEDIDAVVLDFNLANKGYPLPTGLKTGNLPQSGEGLILVGYPGELYDKNMMPIPFFSIGEVINPHTSYFQQKSCLTEAQCILTRQHGEDGISGGPQLNKNGEVVGITWGGSLRGTLSTPISAIIPYLDGGPKSGTNK